MADVDHPGIFGRVDGYNLYEAPQRQARRPEPDAAGDAVLERGELAWLPPAGRYTPTAVNVAVSRPVLPADAKGGELLVARSPSPDGGHVATLWLCVRGAGSGYTPGDPAYWAQVLLGPRFPGTAGDAPDGAAGSDGSRGP